MPSRAAVPTWYCTCEIQGWKQAWKENFGDSLEGLLLPLVSMRGGTAGRLVWALVAWARLQHLLASAGTV